MHAPFFSFLLIENVLNIEKKISPYVDVLLGNDSVHTKKLKKKRLYLKPKN